ncbi:hypothetical protein D3C78_1833510 [compost metagenome]
MLLHDLAQSLEISLGWHQYTGRPGDGFDDHGSDSLGPMHSDDALEVIGQICAVFRLAFRERVFE